jgi:hypothetical protein
MNPMRKRRDLCLASTATQKGDLSALASSTDTSESFDSGPHDNRPVLIQNLPDEERCSTKNVLPTSGFSGGTRPFSCEGTDGRTVSLRRAGVPKPNRSIAHPFVHVNRGCFARGNSSPWLQATGLLATSVEIKLRKGLNSHS